MSADGQRFFFQSSAGNLLSNAPAHGRCSQPLLNPDGRFLLFQSRADNLVADDTNGVADLFVRDLVLNTTLLVSHVLDSRTGNPVSGHVQLGADGRTGSLRVTPPAWWEMITIVRVIFSCSPSAAATATGISWRTIGSWPFFGTLERDGSGDADQDGMREGQEFLAGTDPTNSSVLLRAMTLRSLSTGKVTVLWSAVAGRGYQVQYRSSLSGGEWLNLGGEVTAAGTTASQADPKAGRGGFIA